MVERGTRYGRDDSGIVPKTRWFSCILNVKLARAAALASVQQVSASAPAVPCRTVWSESRTDDLTSDGASCPGSVLRVETSVQYVGTRYDCF